MSAWAQVYTYSYLTTYYYIRISRHSKSTTNLSNRGYSQQRKNTTQTHAHPTAASALLSERKNDRHSHKIGSEAESSLPATSNAACLLRHLRVSCWGSASATGASSSLLSSLLVSPLFAAFHNEYTDVSKKYGGYQYESRFAPTEYGLIYGSRAYPRIAGVSTNRVVYLLIAGISLNHRIIYNPLSYPGTSHPLITITLNISPPPQKKIPTTTLLFHSSAKPPFTTPSNKSRKTASTSD